MILPRIIPCLLLKEKGLVKGTQFKRHQYIGDPINAVHIFNDKEVDELMFLDIIATKEKRIPPLDLIEVIADQCLMPFGVGGGIRTTEEIRQILSVGAEKVCICSAAHDNPDLIREASDKFGVQSIVVSIDVNKNFWGKYEVYKNCGTKSTGQDPVVFAKKMAEQGAGELLINSIDRDGIMKGYDIELILSITNAVNVPVIALGGAGSLNDIKEVIHHGKASAAAAGSLFVYHGPRKAVLINYPSDKEKEIIYIK